ncbi:MAG: Gfo/Idh/MocA family oxidoreductase [Bacteroidota bacterium]
MSRVRIGLLGAGHLGKIHLRLLTEIPAFEVVGFFDVDPVVCQNVEAEFNLSAFPTIEAMIEAVDAVDIVTPTVSHAAMAQLALAAGKHIFIEKPLTRTLHEGRVLQQMLADRPELVGQVGHVERFNPAFQALEGTDIQPLFIEGHRLAQFNPRGTDVSVVLDLMIHDLDIILSVVEAPLKSVHASGVAVVSQEPDIANARLEFENGCVVNLTASRISLKNMRKLRFFQPHAYLSVDFLKKQAEVIRLSDTEEAIAPPAMQMAWDLGETRKYLILEQPKVEASNAIQQELEEFAASILEKKPVRVPVKQALRALETAHRIIEDMERNWKARFPGDELSAKG